MFIFIFCSAIALLYMMYNERYKLNFIDDKVPTLCVTNEMFEASIQFPKVRM